MLSSVEPVLNIIARSSEVVRLVIQTPLTQQCHKKPALIVEAADKSLSRASHACSLELRCLDKHDIKGLAEDGVQIVIRGHGLRAIVA